MRTQEKITRAVLDHASDPEAPFGVAWVLSSASLATPFDKVVVFEHGTVAEIGSPEELIAKNGSFAKLLG
jgi:putative ABC transport system ATP-binding protein